MRLPGPTRSRLGEAIAFARQAWLLRHDVAAPVVPARAAAGDHVVVFLHGIFASAGVLRPLRARVERHRGVHGAAFSYAPGPGVAALAARLEALLDDLPRDVSVHLVGHSLGGVVARHFAQTRRDARVVQTISLASPFAGIPNTALLPFGFGRDLDSAGPFLQALRLTSASLDPPIPHLSIVAGADTMLPSPVTQALPSGEVIVLAGLGHNALLFDAEVASLIERRVLDGRARAA